MAFGVRVKKWIQKAIKRPGAFTAWCKAHGYGGVTQACIAAGKKAKSTRVKRQANLAQTLKRMAKKRRKK